MVDTDEIEEAAREAYSRTEEVVNALTHGAGAALSLVGLLYLVVAVYADGALRVAAITAYGLSLLFAYTSSTLYHAWPEGGVKQFFRRMDHAAIFVLIAGTYTPFTLVTMGPTWGLPLFTLIWVAAIVGTVLKFADVETPSWVDVTVYLAMGWVSLVALPELFASLSGTSFGLLLGGGAAYSLGTIFYLWDGIPLNHAIWHLFVLGGSSLHFVAVTLAI